MVASTGLGRIAGADINRRGLAYPPHSHPVVKHFIQCGFVSSHLNLLDLQVIQPVLDFGVPVRFLRGLLFLGSDILMTLTGLLRMSN